MDLSKSLKHKLVTALTLPLLDWPILAQAWAWLLIVDLSLRVLPFRRVQHLCHLESRRDEESPLPAVEALRRKAVSRPSKTAQGDVSETILHLQQLVKIAARNHLYDMSCLRQSLVLQRLLAQRGIETYLRIGVRKEAGELAAHAWLEYTGQPIGHPHDVAARFEPLAN